jgi:dephospho-CoA kinase
MGLGLGQDFDRRLQLKRPWSQEISKRWTRAEISAKTKAVGCDGASPSSADPVRSHFSTIDHQLSAMPAIGITGGISTGKSTFARCLRIRLPNARFFDADKAARVLTDKDAGVRAEIVHAFGPEIYSPGGDLNRGGLRAIILKDAAKRLALEQILHPRIRSQWSAEAKTYRNSSEFFFADIPLLYETGGETLCDRVVVVACAPAVQLQRLLARRAPGRKPLTESEAMEMIKAQMPLDEKVKRADHVVWNNNGESLLGEQAENLVNLWRTKSWIAK